MRIECVRPVATIGSANLKGPIRRVECCVLPRLPPLPTEYANSSIDKWLISDEAG